MKMGCWAKFAVFLFVIAVAGYFAVGPYGTWRYRMTVEVETPEGIKTGSAVREISVTHGIKIFPESSPPISVKGEAVVVDLGKRGTLFALLGQLGRSTDLAYTVVFQLFPVPGKLPGNGGTTPEGIRYYDGLDKGKAELPLLQMPMMVAFKDRNNPKSVELVYSTSGYNVQKFREGNIPDGLDFRGKVDADNFEKIFGKGVKLKRVTIERTDDPVTTGIEEWLPWIHKRRGIPGYLGAPEGMIDDPTKTYLTGEEFSRGKY